MGSLPGVRPPSPPPASVERDRSSCGNSVAQPARGSRRSCEGSVAAPSATGPSWRTLVERFDREVDRAFDRLRGRRIPDRVFYAASAIGDHSMVWFGLAALAGLRRSDGWPLARRAFVGILAESVIVNLGVKSFFGRSRPSWEDYDHPHPLRTPLTSSFPSGHASAAAVAIVLLSDGGDRLTPFYVATGTIVALSRIHVRIHHASDVVGGAVVGSVLGLAIRKAIPLRR